MIPAAWSSALLKLGAIAVVLSLAFLWHLHDRRLYSDGKVDEYKREFNRAALQASEQARNDEQVATQHIFSLQQEVQHENNRRKADVSRVSSELERLRQFTSANRSAPKSEASASAPRANEACGHELDLLGRAATVAKNLAERADELEAQVVGLQQYASVAQKLCSGASNGD